MTHLSFKSFNIATWRIFQFSTTSSQSNVNMCWQLQMAKCPRDVLFPSRLSIPTTIDLLSRELSRDVGRLFFRLASSNNWVHTVNVHAVDLFKSSVLRLDDEEKDNEEESRATSCEYKAVQVVNCVGDEAGAVWSVM